MRKLVLISLRALAYRTMNNATATWSGNRQTTTVSLSNPLLCNKFYINITVQAKVVFTSNSTADIRLKLTAGKSTVRVKKLTVLTLKKR